MELEMLVISEAKAQGMTLGGTNTGQQKDRDYYYCYY